MSRRISCCRRLLSAVYAVVLPLSFSLLMRVSSCKELICCWSWAICVWSELTLATAGPDDATNAAIARLSAPSAATVVRAWRRHNRASVAQNESTTSKAS